MNNQAAMSTPEEEVNSLLQQVGHAYCRSRGCPGRDVAAPQRQLLQSWARGAAAAVRAAAWRQPGHLAYVELQCCLLMQHGTVLPQASEVSRVGTRCDTAARFRV